MLRSERVLRLVVLVSLLLASSVAGAQSARVERWLARAERAADRGRMAEARRIWRRAARRAPEDGRAAIALAGALPHAPEEVAQAPERIRDQADEARRLLDAHLEVASGEAKEARRARAWTSAVLGEHERAIEAVAGIAGLQDQESAALLRRLATLAALRDDLAAAERALLAAHRALPQESGILSDLGAVELARGHPERAVERFARVLGRAPSDLGARRDLAGALVAAGRAEEALPLLSAAVEAHPEEPELRIELARAALEAGRPRVAEREARAAIAELPPDDARAHTTLGEALAAASRHDGARAAFEEALRRDPDDARARMGLESLRAATAH